MKTNTSPTCLNCDSLNFEISSCVRFVLNSDDLQMFNFTPVRVTCDILKVATYKYESLNLYRLGAFVLSANVCILQYYMYLKFRKFKSLN